MLASADRKPIKVEHHDGPALKNVLDDLARAWTALSLLFALLALICSIRPVTLERTFVLTQYSCTQSVVKLQAGSRPCIDDLCLTGLGASHFSAPSV